MNTSYPNRVQELCESRGGRPGLPFPNSPYGPCERKAAFEEEEYANNADYNYVDLKLQSLRRMILQIFCCKINKQMTLISARKTLHEQDNKDPNRLQ